MNYFKNIGLDLRFLNKNDNYSNFIFLLVKELIKNNPENFYNIYLNKSFLSLNFGENTKNIITNIIPGSLKEQFSFANLLNKNNNDLVIFFDYKNPINYKKNNILFIHSLAFSHFPSKLNFIKKNYLNFLFNKNTKKASKIIVFENSSKDELNDKFNIAETKIEVLKGFFYKIQKEEKENLIDIKIKYNIKGDFFIYSAGTGNHKNLDKLVEIFEDFNKENKNYNLIILDENTIKDLDFRKKVIEKNLTSKIFFIGETNSIEKDFFYKNALGEIYPLSYVSFPFSLNTAINYNKTIFTTKLKNLQNIFQDKLIYFNINDKNDFIKKLETKTKETNYDEIFQNYKISETTKNLINIINNV